MDVAALDCPPVAPCRLWNNVPAYRSKLSIRSARREHLRCSTGPAVQMLSEIQNIGEGFHAHPQGFWRNWHASYNLWLVRYMYVPLGGSRRRALNAWVIFTFVALWHDVEWRLLIWAWLMSLLFAPELVRRWGHGSNLKFQGFDSGLGVLGSGLGSGLGGGCGTPHAAWASAHPIEPSYS